MKDKKLKSLLAGSALIIPVLLISSANQKEANAMLNAAKNAVTKMAKLPVSVNPIKITGKTSGVTLSNAAKNVTKVNNNAVANKNIASNVTTNKTNVTTSNATGVKKTLANIHTTDPQLANSLNKLGGLLKDKNMVLKTVPTNSPNAGKTTTISKTPSNSTSNPVYENVLDLSPTNTTTSKLTNKTTTTTTTTSKLTSKNTTSTSNASEGIYNDGSSLMTKPKQSSSTSSTTNKVPAYNPSKGKAPQPPSSNKLTSKNSTSENYDDHIYETID